MDNIKFKDIKVYKLKEGEKVIFPSVESWYIDLNFEGRMNPDNIIGEVEDYFIKDGYVVADLLIYKNLYTKVANELTPAILGRRIDNLQIKLISLSLCHHPNQDPDIKSIKEQLES